MKEEDIDLLDKMYELVTPWAVSSRAQILKNRIIGRLANYIYPAYCKINPIKKTDHKVRTNKEIIIVSLTSFPARIDKVYLCVNSLLRQSVPADRVILWLAGSQFPNGNGIPKELIKLKSKGLEIRFCDDLRSYKKFFFTAQEYQDSIIITADDDTLYPETWIKGLIDTYLKHPDCVCCYRAHEMVFENGKLLPYKKWNILSPNIKGPSTWLVPIGVGGVLYPPKYFANIEFNFEEIKQVCPTTDDLWLKVIGMKNGYKAVKVNENSKEWFTIKSTQKERLTEVNVDTGENDRSMMKLVKYYNVSLSSFIGVGIDEAQVK